MGNSLYSLTPFERTRFKGISQLKASSVKSHFFLLNFIVKKFRHKRTRLEGKFRFKQYFPGFNGKWIDRKKERKRKTEQERVPTAQWVEIIRNRRSQFMDNWT